MSTQQEIDDFLLNPFLFFGDGQCNRLDEVSAVDGMFKIDKAWYFAIQDGHAALAFLQSLYEQHGKELSHVYAMGQSAGAISALGLALGQQEEFNQFNPLLEGFYGGLKDKVLYNHPSPKGIDGVISVSGGLLNAYHFLSEKDSIPVLFLHGAEDDVVPLCEDDCSYNQRRLSGPLQLTEMAEALELNMPMTLHIWTQKSHSLSSVYPVLSKIALDWLVGISANAEVGKEKPVFVYPENALLRTCASAYAYLDLLDFRRQLTGGGDVVVEGSKVFPNPSQGQFTLFLPGLDAEMVDIEIYDMLGHLAFVERDMFVLWSETEVNAQSLPSGVYQLVVRYNNHVLESHKIVLN
jgi:hypothetical protein